LIAISQGKARTAAQYRRPSKVFEDAINTAGRPSLLGLMVLTNGAPSEGGFPIVVDGKLYRRDAVTANAGLEAIGSK
jgi:glc operon protein GlcG